MSAEGVADTRRSIVEAAERLILDKGIGSATTKEIARAAGCAEGSIYRYFQDKHALFMELVGTRYGGFFDLMKSLPERAGVATVRRNLEEVATSAIDFYYGIVPMVGGALAEHELLVEHREYFHKENTGPMKLIRHLTDYLRAEQRLGRVAGQTSAEHAAQALLGACFAHAFLLRFLGEGTITEPNDRYARMVVKTLLHGLEPKEA
jgi:AcrR family transcriptional regulator